MKPELGVYLKGEVHHCGTLRENYRFALRGECHYIVVVERSYHLFDEAFTLLSAGSDVAEHHTELFDPLPYVVLIAACHASKLRVTYHAFAADVYLLPSAERGKELYMIALVAVFLWRVDVVGDSSRLFLEPVGEYGIYAHHHVFLGFSFRGVKHYFSEMPVFQVIEVVAEFPHLSPQAVRLAVFYIDTGIYAVGRECVADFVAEFFEAFALQVLVTGYHCGEVLIFMWATEFQAEVLKFGLYVV